MKLTQKLLFKGTHEFEIFEDSLVVRSKKSFKEKTTRLISLATLDPEPVIEEARSLVSFNHRDKSGPILSLRLNKPGPQEFEAFILAIKENILRINNRSANQKPDIKAYSQRLTPPFSGLVQIAESERARALTMDGKTWELQYLTNTLPAEIKPGKEYPRRFSHALTVNKEGLQDIVSGASSENFNLDNRLVELARYISEADFPFPTTDIYEYWLLDREDNSPLAMIFSCSEAEQMGTFPNKTEWTALPSAAMPIELTETEKEQNERPVNYRVEQMIAERAGLNKPQAKWFKRHPQETETFPPLLLTEDWQNEEQADLCRRYLNRQSSRLLMLHHLSKQDRKRLEIEARPYVFEVERFYPFYPEIIDPKIINPILVEARLRKNTRGKNFTSVDNRHDSIHYM